MADGGESAPSAAVTGPLVSRAEGAEPLSNTLDKVMKSCSVALRAREHPEVLGVLSQDEIADEIKTL